jgi:hypothetical protein
VSLLVVIKPRRSGALQPVPATPPADITDVGVLATQPVQTVHVSCSASLGGVELADLSVVGGSVTADSRRSMMRDATVTFAPTDDLSQDDIYDLLSAPGVQLAVSRGFELPDGAIVTAPLGVFVIDQLTRIRAGANTGTELTATCSDLSARISRARWTQPYQIAAGTALADAVNQALAFCWPDVDTAIDSSIMSNVLGAQAVYEGGAESDPWADIAGLAESFGYLLAFGADGVVRAQSVPAAASGSPVFTFATGATAIMTKQQRQLLADQMYNGVIVTGEGSANDTPPRGEAWDTNPASPTYLYGPFGAVPTFYSSPMITSQDQAETVAASMLAGVLGKTEQLSWEQVVHPGLEPLDVIAVDFADGISALYLLDSLTIPLTATDVMTAVARTVQVS